MKLQIETWDGKPITQAGIYADVPIDWYHSQEICAGPSVSSSGLRRVLERNGGSPAHFYNEWSGNPKCQEQEEEKKHFILGRAVHLLLLGEAGFSEKFIVRPNEVFDPRTGELLKWSGNRLICKEWVEQARLSGRSVLTEDEIDDIKGMAIAIGAHPEVNIEFKPGRYYSLLNGHIEKSFFWRDKATGLWCKARPDAIPTDSGDYADLKTTTSVAYLDLLRTITDLAYHQQAAMIMVGSGQCGVDMSSYTLVFVEKKRPYCVRPVPLDMADIQLGQAQNRLALDLIARCLHERRWPGPGDDSITSIKLAPRYREAVQEDIRQVESAKGKVA